MINILLYLIVLSCLFCIALSVMIDVKNATPRKHHRHIEHLLLMAHSELVNHKSSYERYVEMFDFILPQVEDHYEEICPFIFKPYPVILRGGRVCALNKEQYLNWLYHKVS